MLGIILGDIRHAWPGCTLVSDTGSLRETLSSPLPAGGGSTRVYKELASMTQRGDVSQDRTALKSFGRLMTIFPLGRPRISVRYLAEVSFDGLSLGESRA
jgi:hypothetical protein